MTLLETFAALPPPSAPGFYTVEHGAGTYRVGRSYEGHPALLIEFPSTGSSSLAVRLANLTYAPPSMVDLAGSDGSKHRARLAILECRTDDKEMSLYFFRMVSALLLNGPSGRSTEDFEKSLDTLVTLFQALQRPGVRTIQGLWAELAIINWALDVGTAMSSWHSSPRALHDFSAGSFRLEVKASLTGLREHSFRLDQLATIGPGVTLVASILLDEADGGASIFDLVDEIASRIGPEAASRLETIVADSLGIGWRDARDIRFSLDGARDSLRIYSAKDVPTIPQPLPPEIKDVHFAVDLSNTMHLDLGDGRSKGELFAKILPK